MKFGILEYFKFFLINDAYTYYFQQFQLNTESVDNVDSMPLVMRM